MGFIEHVYVYALSICTTSCIRSHYKNVSTPRLGDELECRREADNHFDRYAVAVLKQGVVVGHLPRLPLTRGSTYVMALLDLLVDFRELFCRWKSGSPGSIVSLTLLFNMLTITCGFVSYFLILWI